MFLVLALGALAVWLVVSNGKSGGGKRRPLDINTASFEQLDAIPYITPDAARGIVAGRPFESVDDLLRVAGIGEKTLAKIREFVKVD